MSINIGFNVDTEVTIDRTDFWDIKPCIKVDVHRRFGITYYLRHVPTHFLVSILVYFSTVKLEEIYSSKNSVDL
jgi:hypothetical protein